MWGCGHWWGAISAEAGTSEGEPCCVWEGLSIPAPSIPVFCYSGSFFQGQKVHCEGGRILPSHLVSASCSLHPWAVGYLLLYLPSHKRGLRSPMVGSQGWEGSRRNGPSVGSVAFLAAGCPHSRGRGPGLCTSAVCGDGGMGPLTHPQVGPQARAGTEPPFRRKAKLPKQINRSVKKKPLEKESLNCLSQEAQKGNCSWR